MEESDTDAGSCVSVCIRLVRSCQAGRVGWNELDPSHERLPLADEGKGKTTGTSARVLQAHPMCDA